MRDVFCEPGTESIPLTLVAQAELAEFQNSLDARDRAWVAANGFTANAGQLLALPDPEGKVYRVLAGISARRSVGTGSAAGPAGGACCQFAGR